MTLRAAIAIASLIAAAPAFAGANCVCRANGKDFEEGQVACLRLPSGMRLARCERVLNNTSWKMLGEGCPAAAVTPVPQPTPSSVGTTSFDSLAEG